MTRRWYDPVLDFFFIGVIFLVCLWAMWISCEPSKEPPPNYRLPENVKPNMDSEK